MKFWSKIALALVAVWAVAGGMIYLAQAAKPTPEKVAACLREDLAGKSAAERAKRIDRAADMLNRLSFEDRQKLRGDRAQERFFRALTPEEQGRFLDATLPSGFKQIMENFNKMEPAKRKQFVERAVAEMKKHEGEEAPRPVDEALQQKIVNQGLRSFYNDANADVKLDLAPLIEELGHTNFGR